MVKRLYLGSKTARILRWFYVNELEEINKNNVEFCRLFGKMYNMERALRNYRRANKRHGIGDKAVNRMIDREPARAMVIGYAHIIDYMLYGMVRGGWLKHKRNTRIFRLSDRAKAWLLEEKR